MSPIAAASGLLRRLDPETAHRLAILALKAGLGPRAAGDEDAALSTTIAGLTLRNPIGLAAGFDKNAEAPRALLACGFGFVECGTVTPLPQSGNTKPRLFRLTAERAVINRMGFNNDGLEPFAQRLARGGFNGVVGANLGANKDSQDRAGDYVAGLKRLEDLCDYLTINISSPNTPGLRALQARETLDGLLGRVSQARRTGRPIFLKIAPDLEEEEIRDIVQAVRKHGLDGVIATNTTISRPAGLTSPSRSEAGGLSGAPLKDLSTLALRRLRAMDRGLPLIGVGGVASGADAYEKICAGADAVQLYTALVFEGPDLVARIKTDLAKRLRETGWPPEEAVSRKVPAPPTPVAGDPS